MCPDSPTPIQFLLQLPLVSLAHACLHIHSCARRFLKLKTTDHGSGLPRPRRAAVIQFASGKAWENETSFRVDPFLPQRRRRSHRPVGLPAFPVASGTRA